MVRGTGPNGIVTVKDVKASTKTTAKVSKKYDLFGYVERVPLKGIRKITAEKMMQAVSSTAMLTHRDHVDVTELSKVRKSGKVRLSYLPFIIKATIEALKKHPYVSSSMEDNEIILKKYYNIVVNAARYNTCITHFIEGCTKFSTKI